MDVDFRHMHAIGFFTHLMIANLALLLFNLLPAFPMDGGRVLRALLARRMDYLRATHLAASVGQAMAIVFGIVGMFLNPFLMFIAIFVYLGAGQEASMVETRRAMQGVPLKYAMMKRFQSLAPNDSLQRAADELLAGAQHDFPVVEGDRVVGMLSRDDLIRAFQVGDKRALVCSIMRRDCPIVTERDLLDVVFRRMQEEGCSSLPVVSDNRLVGIITLENIGELVLLSQASERLPSNSSSPTTAKEFHHSAL